MSQITIEFQKSIQDKINAAWLAKKWGDCFMQKNNFAEIIVVHKYDLEEMESQGWDFFGLACYKNPLYVKPKVEIEIKAKEEVFVSMAIKEDLHAANFYEIYDCPDAKEAGSCGF